MIKFLKLFFSILLCLIVGFFGSLSTQNSVTTWYPTLEKPQWSPPDWIFGPVWIILYILMGISFWFIWKKRIKSPVPYLIFFLQLFLNSIWTYLFFHLKNPLLGLLDIMLLLIAILITMVSFYKYSKIAAWLLVPYFLWVLFATFLNYSIWKFLISFIFSFS